LRTVGVEDHHAVIRLLIDRYDGLVSARTQATCRLHVVLRELIAGGAPRRLSANRTAKLLRSVHPAGLVAVERKRLAVDLLADVRRLDQQIATTRSRITDAVEDSNTTLLELHGVGPIVAAYILGRVALCGSIPMITRHRSPPHRRVWASRRALLMKVPLASFEPRRDRTSAGWRFVQKPTRHASSRQFESQPTETPGRYEHTLNARPDPPSGRSVLVPDL
jgi:hypothetical protein